MSRQVIHERPLSNTGLNIEKNAKGNAVTVLNQQGAGPILAASASGVPKFTIANDGSVTNSVLPTTTDTYDLGSASLEWNNLYAKNIITTGTTGQNGYWQRNASGGYNYLAPNTTADLLSIGQTTGLTTTGLSVKVNSLGNAAAYVENSGGSGDIFTASSAGVAKFVIDKNGNVGIGTSNFYDKLSVNGAADVLNQLNILGTWAMVQSGWNSDLQLKSQGSGNILLFPSNGLIGINTSNPLSTLDIRAGSGVLATASISGQTSLASLIVDNSGVGDVFAASSSGLSRFVVTQNGNIGINTANPTAPLYVMYSTPNTGANTPALVLDNPANNSDNTSLMLETGGNNRAVVRADNNGQMYLSATGTVHVGTSGLNGLHLIDFLYDGTSGSVNMNTKGYVGIGYGLNSPLATLDVRPSKTLSGAGGGTIAIASISGQTSFAAGVVDNSGVGDIWTASSSGLTRFVITQNGNVGIGTSNPTHTLVVSANCTSITGNPGTCGDYAEYYNASEVVSPADVVSLDPSTPDGKLVQRTRGAYDEKVIGVAATNPAFVIEEDKMGIGGGMVTPSTKPPIALAGRVPTKVSTVNGIIHTGDAVTSSTLVGFGMKLTHAGPTVGKAMEDFDPANGYNGEGIIPCPDGTPTSVICGKIYVFINVSYADPSVVITDSGNLSVGGQEINNTISSATVSSTQSSSNSASLDQINLLSTTISTLQSQIASMSSQLGRLDDLSKQVTDLQKTVNLNQWLSGTSTQSAILGASITNGDTTVGGNLNVLGRSVVSDLGITGKLTTGLLTIDGMDTTMGTSAASINTLSGPLMIQPLAVNGVDFINGKVTIDTNGNIVTMGDITAKTINADKVNLKDNGDNASVGEALIPAGKTSIEVKTSSVTDTSKIFVTVKGSSPIPISVISQNSAVSFTVERNADLNDEVKFSWWIIN